MSFLFSFFNPFLEQYSTSLSIKKKLFMVLSFKNNVKYKKN
tara:strand:+ start:403 stop:525 length:123 start_codon:yes stop_codon:yes gene_type:complete